ncbi:hypothetical protein L6452_38962 [Arctium lappa]|uniref:Uncharacterized protein n=1 Tax=Arctium lappa TaxID=4217 RepID=A0ACB8XQE1_ARCLA|nr:hypothetical protein L6452_38962 [Arctium lappa]
MFLDQRSRVRELRVNRVHKDSRNQVSSFLSGERGQRQFKAKARKTKYGKDVGEEKSDCNSGFLNKCIIGLIKDVENLESISLICLAEGLEVILVKFLGGLDVLLQLDFPETTKSIVENDIHGIQLWTNNIRL